MNPSKLKLFAAVRFLDLWILFGVVAFLCVALFTGAYWPIYVAAAAILGCFYFGFLRNTLLTKKDRAIMRQTKNISVLDGAIACSEHVSETEDGVEFESRGVVYDPSSGTVDMGTKPL